MTVDYGDVKGWESVIVNDVTDLMDVVCPDCVTEYDLSRPELAELLERIDSDIRAICGIPETLD